MKKYATLFLLPLFAFAQNTHDPVAVEKAVKEAFKDAPIMVEVARCESKFRQFADSGNVMYGGTDNKMVGIFQIYGDIHRAKAQSMNMNIDTVEGNIAYAKYLHGRKGTNPWISSMPCWNPNPVHEQTANTGSLGATLIFGMSHPEVVTLQKILNKSGYVVATEGPGSPGNETTLFGNLTRIAVRRFQCEQNIVCAGDENTTAFGVVGPRTRIALSKFVDGKESSTPPTTPSDSAEEKERARVAGIKAKIAELKRQIAELEAQL